MKVTAEELEKLGFTKLNGVDWISSRYGKIRAYHGEIDLSTLLYEVDENSKQKTQANILDALGAYRLIEGL